MTKETPIAGLVDAKGNRSKSEAAKIARRLTVVKAVYLHESGAPLWWILQKMGVSIPTIKKYLASGFRYDILYSLL